MRANRWRSYGRLETRLTAPRQIPAVPLRHRAADKRNHTQRGILRTFDTRLGTEDRSCGQDVGALLSYLKAAGAAKHVPLADAGGNASSCGPCGNDSPRCRSVMALESTQATEGRRGVTGGLHECIAVHFRHG